MSIPAGSLATCYHCSSRSKSPECHPAFPTPASIPGYVCGFIGGMLLVHPCTTVQQVVQQKCHRCGPTSLQTCLAFSRNNRVCLLSLSCVTLTWLPNYNPASSIITSSNKSPCETQPSGNPLTTEIRLQSRAWC